MNFNEMSDEVTSIAKSLKEGVAALKMDPSEAAADKIDKVAADLRMLQTN